MVSIVRSLASIYAAESFVSWISYYGVAAGVYGLSKGVARDTHRLRTAAIVNELCILNSNFVNLILGIVVRIIEGRPNVQRYLRSQRWPV